MRDTNLVYTGHSFWACFTSLLTGGSSAPAPDAAGAASEAGRTTEWAVFAWGVEATSSDRLEGVAGTFLSKIFDLMTTFAGSFISEANMSFKETCYKEYKLQLYIFKTKLHEKSAHQ